MFVKSVVKVVFFACLILSVAAGLCVLGFWQLGRAEVKQNLLDAFSARQQQPAVALLHLDDWLAYTPVFAEGAFLPVQLLLDNQTFEQQVGYRWYGVLRLSSGLHVLVDRGWVLAPPSRQDMPVLSLSADRLSSLEGYLWPWPGVSFSLGAESSVESFDPLYRLQNLDKVVVESMTGLSLASKILRVKSGVSLLKQPFVSVSPAKHQAYAFQWFALALAWVVLWVVLLFKPRFCSRTKYNRLKIYK